MLREKNFSYKRDHEWFFLIEVKANGRKIILIFILPLCWIGKDFLMVQRSTFWLNPFLVFFYFPGSSSSRAGVTGSKVNLAQQRQELTLVQVVWLGWLTTRSGIISLKFQFQFNWRKLLRHLHPSTPWLSATCHISDWFYVKIICRVTLFPSLTLYGKRRSICN